MEMMWPVNGSGNEPERQEGHLDGRSDQVERGENISTKMERTFSPLLLLGLRGPWSSHVVIVNILSLLWKWEVEKAINIYWNDITNTTLLYPILPLDGNCVRKKESRTELEPVFSRIRINELEEKERKKSRDSSPSTWLIWMAIDTVYDRQDYLKIEGERDNPVFVCFPRNGHFQNLISSLAVLLLVTFVVATKDRNEENGNCIHFQT